MKDETIWEFKDDCADRLREGNRDDHNAGVDRNVARLCNAKEITFAFVKGTEGRVEDSLIMFDGLPIGLIKRYQITARAEGGFTIGICWAKREDGAQVETPVYTRDATHHTVCDYESEREGSPDRVLITWHLEPPT